MKYIQLVLFELHSDHLIKVHVDSFVGVKTIFFPLENLVLINLTSDLHEEELALDTKNLYLSSWNSSVVKVSIYKLETGEFYFWQDHCPVWIVFDIMPRLLDYRGLRQTGHLRHLRAARVATVFVIRERDSEHRLRPQLPRTVCHSNAT